MGLVGLVDLLRGGRVVGVRALRVVGDVLALLFAEAVVAQLVVELLLVHVLLVLRTLLRVGLLLPGLRHGQGSPRECRRPQRNRDAADTQASKSCHGHDLSPAR